MGVASPPEGDDWVGIGTGPLPIADALAWARRSDCGGVVLFTGDVRNCSPGRPGVTGLTYEAYEEEVVPRLAAIAADTRRRWPSVGRVVLLHRTGRLDVGESSVVVVVSAPHRAEAFDAARHCIDTLKHTVPIWKLETWDGGEDWSAGCSPVDEVDAGPAVDSHAIA